jgi:hypothetical protein
VRTKRLRLNYAGAKVCPDFVSERAKPPFQQSKTAVFQHGPRFFHFEPGLRQRQLAPPRQPHTGYRSSRIVGEACSAVGRFNRVICAMKAPYW